MPFLFLMMPTLGKYVAIRVSDDLRAHHFANCRLFFALGAILALMLTLVDAFVGGQPFVQPENAVRLPKPILVILAALLTVALFIAFFSVPFHA